MKKIVFRPIYIVIIIVLIAAVGAGALYALRNTTPVDSSLSPAEQAEKKRFQPLEDCLIDANKPGSDTPAAEKARNKCLSRYPDL